MSDAALQVVLGECGKELKVPTMLRVYPELARHARDGGWPCEEFVKRLFEAEIRERRDHCVARRIREVPFPIRRRWIKLIGRARKGFRGRRSWNWRVVSMSSGERTWSSPAQSNYRHSAHPAIPLKKRIWAFSERVCRTRRPS